MIKNTMSPPNMSGAIFSERNALLQRLLILVMNPVMIDQRFDALDEFRDALQRDQREAERDQIYWPTD